jgi:carbonic anhydrase
VEGTVARPGGCVSVDVDLALLEQFHFPHPSEEHVTHLVHADADGHNAVVAILFEKGAAPSPLLDDAAMCWRLDDQ